MNLPLLRLFQAVVIDPQTNGQTIDLHAATIPYGFVFAPEVTASFSESALRTSIPWIAKELGMTKEQFNAAFHKSWKKVRDAPLEVLYTDQLVHYLTTYGAEAIGIYEKDNIFIPIEKLRIPDRKDNEKIKLVVIHGLTIKEVVQRIKRLLSSGIALKKETIDDIVQVIMAFELLQALDIDTVKNKEVKCILCDRLHTIPKNPVEFLRYMLYKLTDTTLLIKNVQTITAIHDAVKVNNEIGDLFEKYQEQYGLEGLASIFYRFKPIFLAFRNNDQLRSTINRIRKLAIDYHKPMPEDYLNQVTAHLKTDGLDQTRLVMELAKVNVFRKIRLAYALNYRLLENDAILYRIRNGKSYATTLDVDQVNITEIRTGLDIILQSIADDLAKNIAGKRIYFDPQVQYALPATEKQFTGNIPCGSFITLPTSMIIGIHWTNLTPQINEDRDKNDYAFADPFYRHNRAGRVDLDLSLMGLTKIGWDGSYRHGDGDILFSGDITDAPNGATEAFYIKTQEPNTYLLMLNHFSRGHNDVQVPFTLFAARENGFGFGRHYVVNPNKVEMWIPNVMDSVQKMLGLIVLNKKQTVFYFGETSIGNSNTAKDKPYVHQARSYMETTFTHPLLLRDVLIRAGAIVTDKQSDADIDLSVQTLQKDTILSLLMQEVKA